MSVMYEATMQLPPPRADILALDTSRDGSGAPARRLRTACDYCHQAKVKCSGGARCARCARDNLACFRSYTAKMGKPKGTKCKKSTEKPGSSPRRKLAADRRRESTWFIEDDGTMSKQLSRRTSSAEDVAPGLAWLPSPPVEEYHEYTHTAATTPKEDPLRMVTPDDAHELSFASTTQYQTVLDLVPSDDHVTVNGYSIHSITNSPSHKQREASTGVADMTQASPPNTSRRWSEDAAYSSKMYSCSGVTSDYFAVPPTPPDSTLGIESELLSSNLSHLGIYSPATMSPPQQASRISCTCLQRAAAQLSQLDAVEQQQPTIQLDTLLQNASLAMTEAEGILRCLNACTRDMQVLLTNIMVLQTIFRWAEKIGMRDPCEWPRVSCSMGCFQVQAADEYMLRDMLVERVWRRCGVVLDMLRDRIEQCDTHGTSDMATASADVGYLRHATQMLAEGLVRILQGLREGSARRNSC